MKYADLFLFIVAIGLIALVIKNKKAIDGSPKISIKKKLFNNFNAITVPPFGIFISEQEKENEKLIAHELIHWSQYQRMGLIKYYLNYFTQLLKNGYDKMPMEREARLDESDYCKNNYTECVRTGNANTVYNPLFRKPII